MSRINNKAMKQRIKDLLKKILFGRPKLNNPEAIVYDFNKSNPLGGNGERVDITHNDKIDFSILDLYQKNHYKRYEFAVTQINNNSICGDFACGSGYGTVMLAEKSAYAIGWDIDLNVIEAIKKRYGANKKVEFHHNNLLNISYTEYFDFIISFETLEHFSENEIYVLVKKFSDALKNNGKLIFSTPYMQEESEAALKLGFHKTFYIDETKLTSWLHKAGLVIEVIKYQNYQNHEIVDVFDEHDFIICIAKKII